MGRFESELLAFVRSGKSAILDEIKNTGNLSDENKEALKAAIDEFKGKICTIVVTCLI